MNSDNFLETNNLYDVIFEDKEYDHVLEVFRTARLSEKLRDNLRKYLQVMTKPLAVRSSGLFEDSLNQPFAGVYSTYLLPNNHPDFERRLEDVENAIKLVFASIYSPESRAYFNAIDYMIEEEKMAVIIQEVIGNEHNGRILPRNQRRGPTLQLLAPSPISNRKTVRRHCHRVGCLRCGR